MKFDTSRSALQFLMYVFAVLGAGVSIYSGVSILNSGITTTAFAQQDAFLERRLSQIEQRFTFIETRINRIEQASINQRITPSVTDNNDTEIRLLRTQLESLQLRLAETECGLLRLDERTLSNTARQSRKRSDASTDERCRQNPGAALRLSARP